MHGNSDPPRPKRFFRSSDLWTATEIDLLRRLWPDRALIEKRFPYRTSEAIRIMAKKCGLVPDKEQHIWTGKDDAALKRMLAAGTQVRAIAEQLRITIAQVRNRMNYRRLRVARRRPVRVVDPLVDSIRQRAFDRNVSLADLDRSLGGRMWFASYSSKQGVSPAAIARATKALGGSLTIVWEDDE